MKEISILIGGESGYGILEAGVLLCKILGSKGYQLSMYNDYPSLVRGGHQFTLLRASVKKQTVHTDKVDVLLALNQETLDLHQNRLHSKSILIYDSLNVKIGEDKHTSYGIPVKEIQKQESAGAVPGAYCLIGAFCKVIGIDLEVFESLLEKHDFQGLEEKYRIGAIGYEKAENNVKLDALENSEAVVISGCQAIGLGLLKAGLQAYVGYPMTPTSPLLEFMAELEPEFGLHVVLPESEIAVMMMALGYSYAGVKNAIGTSGGGFSLMVEALGLAGQAELPVVVVLGQRSGPSTGMPTYTAQADLLFALHASQGEFPRFIVAPGDLEEAYYWAGVALNKAWKYQIPAFVLVDKTLCLGWFSFDKHLAPDLQEENHTLWEGQNKYNRYEKTGNGISPMAFAPLKGQAVKINSYVHDEYGVTSEKPIIAQGLADKWALKEKNLAEELVAYDTVKSYQQGETALLFWGSNKGACLEIADKYRLKAIQIVVLAPFPQKGLAKAIEGVKKVIVVECNKDGQLAQLLRQNGFQVDEEIHKYDGRPFSLEDLDAEVKKVMK